MEINDLRLEHTPGLNPLSPSTPLSMHGSATIACFVDSYPLNIAINHCRIITAATTAISFDAINSPYRTTPAKKHSVKVTKCTISGRVHPLETWPLDSPIWDKLELLFGLQTMRQLDPGNYIGVKLRALHPGQKPIDMSGSVFEVSGCTIDSGKWAGVAAGFLESNQSSVFRVVSKNYVGYHPSSSLEGTRVGVIFMNGSVIDSSLESWAKGTIDVNSNYIKLQKYFPFPPPDWSTGILVRVNSALAQTNTTINHNEVEFTQSTLPSWPAGTNPTDLLMDGILYQDDKEPLVSANAKVFITDNVLVSPTVKPLRGISLIKRAHDVMVTNNNLTKLTASHAQIYVDPEAYNCNVSGNVP